MIPKIHAILLDLDTKDEVLEWLKNNFCGEEVRVRYKLNRKTGEYALHYLHGWDFYAKRVIKAAPPEKQEGIARIMDRCRLIHPELISF